MPKIVDHDEHRKVLLRRCFDLFCRRGFANVTMREIAREIGVSTGALYHYFPTKEDILAQMFVWAVEDDISTYSRRAVRDLPPGERVERIVDFWSSRADAYRSLLVLAMDLFRNRPEGSEAVFDEFAAVFKEAISRALGVERRVSEVVFTYLFGVVAQLVFTPKRYLWRKEAAFVAGSLQALLEGKATLPAPRRRRAPRKGAAR